MFCICGNFEPKMTTNLINEVLVCGNCGRSPNTASLQAVIKSKRVPAHKYERTMFNKYGDSIVVDVYDVLEAFKVTCSALAHLAKKVLCAGLRGHKDKEEDLQDICDSAERAKQLNKYRE